ncbi:Efflux transporter, RND family, MFP subunit [Candidatus Methylopumilus planktonicus]|uniref:Efflux transporter, RND family, MFP subunit n=1 Tax=Candidatus Methylopumilus planktonicus TaxID=1581557 RepID=A0A0D6EX66_9PROT|nr:efflux RND transporter periplasmic adaptor subunit [Candidatus Methylopumilus planktonicus]CEZ20242.1 Efflux transporter, RND family, MFP subunit [Candidatus Methylopumilus planktonicus]
MKKLATHLINIALILAFLFGAYYVYQLSNKKKPEDLYRLQPVTMGDIEQNVTANGTINPVTLVNVGTQVSGRVKKIYADYNDQVKKGQILLELEDELFKAQIAQSLGNVKNNEASLELAKANEARMRNLLQQEYVSKQELDQAIQALKSAEAQLSTTKAQLKRDQTNYGYSIIKSPVAGVVVDRVVDVGQTVAASLQTPTLFKIAQDLSKMQIDTSYAEADIGRIRVGQTAKFNVDAFPNQNFEGMVKQIRLNPTNTANVVTYDVVISVDNPDQLLLPGMTAYVNINFAKHDNVLLVPNAALRYRPKNEEMKLAMKKDKKPDDNKAKTNNDGLGSGKVYVLRNNKPEMIRVKTSITNGKFTEIVSSDIKPNEFVITADMSTDQKPGGSNAQGPSRPPRVF